MKEHCVCLWLATQPVLTLLLFCSLALSSLSTAPLPPHPFHFCHKQIFFFCFNSISSPIKPFISSMFPQTPFLSSSPHFSPHLLLLSGDPEKGNCSLWCVICFSIVSSHRCVKAPAPLFFKSLTPLQGSPQWLCFAHSHCWSSQERSVNV